jgi:hypothetical protein
MDPVLFRWLALIVALGAILVSFLLRYHRLASLRICFILVSLLLIYKIAEIPYEISHSYYVIPYEVSHLAYYVVPLLLLSGLPGSDFASGALSLITGVGFLLGALIRPDSLIEGMSRYETVRLLVTHELSFCLLAAPIYHPSVFQERLPCLLRDDGWVCHLLFASQIPGYLP